MKAFDEKGRRWFARTNVEMVVGWAEEPEFQRLLRLPCISWEYAFYFVLPPPERPSGREEHP